MMYRNLFICFLLCLLSFSKAEAQIDNSAVGYYNDALRFSQLSLGGTSRFLGLAGATSAIGGDMGNVAGNPAGLGFYRKSEFSITPAFNFSGTTSSFLGSSLRDNRQSLNISNFGVVFSGAKDDLVSGSWRGGSFAIAYTRTNNFQNQFSYSGVNKNNSLTESFVENLNGVHVSNFYDVANPDEIQTIEQLAFYSFLIDTVNNGPGRDDEYFSYITGSNVTQEEQVVTRGGQNIWNISYGGNVEDKLYLGFSVGIPTIKYLSSKVYKEIVTDPSFIDNYSLSSSLSIRGTGVNLKIGTIFRPSDWIRLGLSLQSPTFYGMREEYRSDIFTEYTDASFLGVSEIEAQTVPGSYSYTLTAPARVKGGIALFSGKSGFLSADVEYVAHNSSRFNGTDPEVFYGDNRTIKNIYKPGVNFALGGEIRSGIYRFRAGFNVLGDAYKTTENINRNIYNATAGAGIRMSDFYFDIALINSRSNGIYNPYSLSDGSGPSALIKNRNTTFAISAGTFF